MSFWLLGTGSGRTYKIVFSDNQAPDALPGGDTAERFERRLR